LWETAVLPAVSTHELSFPVHVVNDEMVAAVDTNTGYAVANLSNWGNAHVTAQLLNANGSLKGEETFSVDMLGHRAEFLSELFNGAMNAQGDGPEPDYFAIDLTPRQTSSIPRRCAGLRIPEPSGCHTSRSVLTPESPDHFVASWGTSFLRREKCGRGFLPRRLVDSPGL